MSSSTIFKTETLRVFGKSGAGAPAVMAPALGPYTKRGSTANFTVFFDNSLGTNGQNLADAVLANCEQDFSQLQAWFGGTAAGPFNVFIDPGNNGGSHATCAATDLHCDAFSGTDGALVNLVNVAEADEVFMANQNVGWDCRASNGEGLSRVLARERYPAKLNGFATGASWLDSDRPDWVTNTEPTDVSGVSTGCATLFINYLRQQLGFNLFMIVQAGGATLAQTHINLTGSTDAFVPFAALLQQTFPPGVPSGLTNDNPFPVAQTNWRWCNKCQGRFFGGNPGSVCPAGGEHSTTGSGNYALVLGAPGAAGQQDWRWCIKCEGMFFGDNPGSVCPAGGQHDATGSGNYVLMVDAPGFSGQQDWRWCKKCQGLFFGDNPGSVCPGGGQHDATGSGNYALVEVPEFPSQSDWRWCNKCQGLFFGDNPGSVCPASGQHDATGSGNYTLIQNVPGFPGQQNWNWCNKCQGMFFGGNPGSVCPAGGQHDNTGSGNYVIIENQPGFPGQQDWGWCNKCQGLFFGDNPGSVCPAGGQHDSTGSGNYVLI